MFLFITSHQRSGTSIYTRKLTAYFPKGGYSILQSTQNVKDVLTMPFKTILLARKSGHYFVLIQYEYSLFGSPLLTHIVLVVLLMLAKISSLNTVVVLHGVLHPRHIGGGVIGFFARILLTSFYRFIETMCSKIYVLNVAQYKLLTIYYGIKINKLKVIPHGVDPCRSDDEEHEREGDERIAIFFHGFLRPSKGLDELLDAVNILSQSGLNVHLKIWGSLPHQVLRVKEEREWIKKFLEKARILVERDLGEVRIGFATEEELKRAIRNSKVIVLPYKDNYFESSGVLHLFMECGKPFVLSRIPRFYADVRQDEAVFVEVTGPEIANGIIKALNEGEKIARKLKDKGNERSWEKIAFLYIRNLLGENT